jgi:hypothetical protein
LAWSEARGRLTAFRRRLAHDGSCIDNRSPQHANVERILAPRTRKPVDSFRLKNRTGAGGTADLRPARMRLMKSATPPNYDSMCAAASH